MRPTLSIGFTNRCEPVSTSRRLPDAPPHWYVGGGISANNVFAVEQFGLSEFSERGGSRLLNVDSDQEARFDLVALELHWLF